MSGASVISHIVGSTIHLVYLFSWRPQRKAIMNLIIGTTGSVATIKLKLMVDKFQSKMPNCTNKYKP